MTKGFPSRSPPIQEPKRRNGPTWNCAAGQRLAQGALELAVDGRHGVEERALEVNEARSHLVERGGALGAPLPRGGEGGHQLAQAPGQPLALAGTGPRVVEEVEHRADAAEVVEHGAPPGLGGMGGEHRHHQQSIEQRLDLAGRGPAGVQFLHRRRERALHRRLRAIARPEQPGPVRLLRRVEEVEEVGEGLGQELQPLNRLGVQRRREGLPPAGELPPPQGERRLAHPLDERERVLAVQLCDRLPQHAPEQAHALAQRGFVLTGSRHGHSPIAFSTTRFVRRPSNS